MTRVVVNDASCLIDLDKVGLLPALCDLPFEFIVPLPIRRNELHRISDCVWRHLDRAGMITHDLTPDEVARALSLGERHRALSANDCFCLVVALVRSGTLLTGDASLRKVATKYYGLPVHGVLWIFDELKTARICTNSRLSEVLTAWRHDSTVFLPHSELDTRMESLR